MTSQIFWLSQIEAPQPIGTVSIVTAHEQVIALDFGAVEERLLRFLHKRFGADVRLQYNEDTANPALFATLAVQRYFAGDFTALNDLTVNGGGSPFQNRVWAALREIPAGTTCTYGEIAQRIGSPGAARAVGLANGSNPINLIVPCHRIIGASGALTGYGGGLARKQWLLGFERACGPNPLQPSRQISLL